MKELLKKLRLEVDNAKNHPDSFGQARYTLTMADLDALLEEVQARQLMKAADNELTKAANGAWITGHQNRALRFALKLATLAIEQAITDEDGLDGSDGEGLLKLVDRAMGLRPVESEVAIAAMGNKIKSADKMARAAGDTVDTKGSLETLQPLSATILEYGKVKVPLP